MSGAYQFFSHTDCEYYPCHDMPEGEALNCLFCYCPLYALGPSCGGNPSYVGPQGDIKDCSHCTVPHRRENYAWIIAQTARLRELARPEKGAHGEGADIGKNCPTEDSEA